MIPSPVPKASRDGGLQHLPERPRGGLGLDEARGALLLVEDVLGHLLHAAGRGAVYVVGRWVAVWGYKNRVMGMDMPAKRVKYSKTLSVKVDKVSTEVTIEYEQKPDNGSKIHTVHFKRLILPGSSWVVTKVGGFVDDKTLRKFLSGEDTSYGYIDTKDDTKVLRAGGVIVTFARESAPATKAELLTVLDRMVSLL